MFLINEVCLNGFKNLFAVIIVAVFYFNRLNLLIVIHSSVNLERFWSKRIVYRRDNLQLRCHKVHFFSKTDVTGKNRSK